MDRLYILVVIHDNFRRLGIASPYNSHPVRETIEPPADCPLTENRKGLRSSEAPPQGVLVYQRTHS